MRLNSASSGKSGPLKPPLRCGGSRECGESEYLEVLVDALLHGLQLRFIYAIEIGRPAWGHRLSGAPFLRPTTCPTNTPHKLSQRVSGPSEDHTADHKPTLAPNKSTLKVLAYGPQPKSSRVRSETSADLVQYPIFCGP